MSETIALISVGGGNMASAIVLGAVERGALRADRVVVVDPNERQRERFREVGVGACASLGEVDWGAAAGASVMLAVKPQMLRDVASGVGEVLGDGGVVWSILAGVPSATVRERCGGAARVVRLMPNTPARVGKGCTALAMGAGAVDGDDVLARRVFGAIGQVVEIAEAQMDAFTAVAGSGPAYFFARVEALAAAGERAGLGAEVAMAAARQTAIGAAGLLEASEEGAAALREAVTSKGGTTAAGLGGLAEAGFAEAVERGVLAARDRGAELGRASAE
ncbi:MAG: pyrroline-5-carboxylate reductase [Phycisphaerales bacterium JB050]